MILRRGSKGVNVIELQKLLKEYGYYSPPLKVDGDFGKGTYNAVIQFQLAKGLVDDGIVGRNTWDALSLKKIELIPVNPPSDIFEDEGEDVNIWELPKVDGKYPTSPSAVELVKFIKQFNFTRKINKIVWHCTASHQTTTTKGIMDYFLKTKKWSKGGYHIIIDARGEWTYCVDFNSPSNGVANMNSNILNISYIGGIDKNIKPIDNRTPKQLATMELIYYALKDKLPLATHHGHKEFANKACPCYEVREWEKLMLTA